MRRLRVKEKDVEKIYAGKKITLIHLQKINQKRVVVKPTEKAYDLALGLKELLDNGFRKGRHPKENVKFWC
jgi:hypothetical protein